MDDLINVLKQGLTRRGKTQRGLARAIGVDDSAVSRILKGERQIKATEMQKALAYLEMPPPGSESPADAMPTQTLREKALPALAEIGSWPRDVPILGVTVGGDNADFLLNTGEIVDYAKRPAAIANNRRAFALYVQGTSMSRWRDPGNLVYLDPIRPAKPGDHVVVECRPDGDGDGHPAFLKEFVSKTATKLRLRQYNPEGPYELNLSRVINIFRVIEWEELLGL